MRGVEEWVAWLERGAEDDVDDEIQALINL